MSVETECRASMLALFRRRMEYILQKWAFRRSGNSGDSHFEGGADQRLHTGCLLGQNTNSHITLATAPFLDRVHLENTEASVLAGEVCSSAFNTFSASFMTEAKAEKHWHQVAAHPGRIHIHAVHTAYKCVHTRARHRLIHTSADLW